jgi:hypothetical protein
MRLARAQKDGGEDVEMRPIDAAARARVSGPGLRAFRAVGDVWGLSERERIALLGEPPRSTYHQWMKQAREERALSLPLDTLLRISGVLGVQEALGALFSGPGEALVWLKGPHRGVAFGGQAPLDVMLGGGQDGILTVRRHLEAWRAGGLRGAPASATGVPPVRPDDLVFV